MTTTHVEQKTYPVRCSGCRKTVAISDKPTALRNSVYCSDWCFRNPAATPEEERNDQWRIGKAHGIKPVRLARMYGVDHAVVYRTLGRDGK